MLTLINVIAVIGVLAIFFVAAAVATREGAVLADAPADAADLDLPIGPLQPEDLAAVRFGLTLRGYRMSEVDEVLDRVQVELAERDARILELEGRPGAAERAPALSAPSAAVLAPVVTSQQTVPAALVAGPTPVEVAVDDGAFGASDGTSGDIDGPGDLEDLEDDEVEVAVAAAADAGEAEDEDEDAGWAFADSGSARAAARPPAPGDDPVDDDWAMPQVLDLEPAPADLPDAVETADPAEPTETGATQPAPVWSGAPTGPPATMPPMQPPMQPPMPPSIEPPMQSAGPGDGATTGSSPFEPAPAEPVPTPPDPGPFGDPTPIAPPAPMPIPDPLREPGGPADGLDPRTTPTWQAADDDEPATPPS